ncbi:hypothetical protein NE237_016558 [Protea cynaroides]|uniref:Uncharacterized protein n=1 Tax=Protea cynaroides TaxID=273540 RepID=A0A9Q0HF18_9MAGN|nr:hypothetical protein NE237_016558 [Protea cynaroides]
MHLSIPGSFHFRLVNFGIQYNSLIAFSAIKFTMLFKYRTTGTPTMPLTPMFLKSKYHRTPSHQSRRTLQTTNDLRTPQSSYLLRPLPGLNFFNTLSFLKLHTHDGTKKRNLLLRKSGQKLTMFSELKKNFESQGKSGRVTIAETSKVKKMNDKWTYSPSPRPSHC